MMSPTCQIHFILNVSGRVSGLVRQHLADLPEPKKRCDVEGRRCAARVDAAVARARGADGGEKQRGKQGEERKCLPRVTTSETHGDCGRLSNATFCI